jgi:hypothetical protein
MTWWFFHPSRELADALRRRDRAAVRVVRLPFDVRMVVRP